MAGAKRVVFAFGTAGETGQAVLLAQRANAIAATGQDLVWVGLMADIPDDAIMGRVEHGVQRHGQFNHAQTSTKVATGHRDRVDHLGAQLVGQLPQVLARHGAQIGRGIDGVEQRCRGLVGQNGQSFAKGAVMLLFRRACGALQQCRAGCANLRTRPSAL